MPDECRYHGGGSVFLSFIMGAAIGGGLALLFAPRSGEETRDQIRQLGDDARDKIRDIISDAERRVKEAIEEGRELVHDKAEVIASAVEAGRAAYQEAEKEKPAAKPKKA